MILASCSNCCFNGLQYGTVGLSVGYCAQHQVVLRRADETTCGRQFRKDLPAPTAESAQLHHATRFDLDKVVAMGNGVPVGDRPEFIDPHGDGLLNDDIGAEVMDYGVDATKIHSIARLDGMSGGRAEVAWVSLGRTYVRRCAANGGSWTSGLNMLAWAKKRIDLRPDLAPADFRLQAKVPMARQEELAAWSIVMLRLTFIADVAVHAANRDEIEELATLPDEAAAHASTDLKKLMQWVGKQAKPRLERLLPRSRYVRLLTDAKAEYPARAGW